MHYMPHSTSATREAGFDVERGWGKRPSMPRDYIFHNEVNIGNTRIGPDLANVGSWVTLMNGFINIYMNHKQW